MREKGRRDEILEAAARVFGNMGFHRARMEDIALEAGIGKSTIYEYFSSKKQLFDEMISGGLEMFLAHTAEKLENIEDAGEKLRSFVFLHYAFVENYRDMARLIIRSTWETHGDIFDKFMLFRGRVLNFIVQIIEEGMEKGVFREVDPYLAGMLFMGILKEVGIMMHLDKEMDVKALDKMVDYYLHGIKNRENKRDGSSGFIEDALQ